MLKCTKCDNVWSKWLVTCRGFVLGLGGIGIGAFGIIIPIWPLVIRVYTKCPQCNEVTWVTVTKPKIFSKKP
ncbi:MAG: hypothetical protein MUO85_10875 [candidate division Zixibacteria bacterium]|nr:hypothetical protein [candidate division Zixibacteria bacterium]